MQESRSNIERQFQIWREKKKIQKEDIPQHLWSILCEHIASHGEEEITHLAQRLGLSWMRLRGKWLRWKNEQHNTGNKKDRVTRNMASGVPANELTTTNAAALSQEATATLLNVPRRQRVVQRNTGRKISAKIEPDTDQVIHITKVSLPQNSIDEGHGNQDDRHIPRVCLPRCTQPSHNTVQPAPCLQHLSETSASVPKSVTSWMAVISSDKLEMRLGPELSTFDIAEIFVSISTRMKREGATYGLAGISDN
jgi:hypothetical protein